MFNGFERLVRNRGSSHRSPSQAYERASISLGKDTSGWWFPVHLGNMVMLTLRLSACGSAVNGYRKRSWQRGPRILFLIKLQMAGEVEPKLSEHPGSKMWWEKHGLGVEEAEPAPAPSPPVSPETGESLSFCLWSSSFLIHQKWQLKSRRKMIRWPWRCANCQNQNGTTYVKSWPTAGKATKRGSLHTIVP